MIRRSKHNAREHSLIAEDNWAEDSCLISIYALCPHQDDYQVKINMKFGLAEKQHEIKTDKYPETWKS